jgi:hypothetical protein
VYIFDMHITYRNPHFRSIQNPVISVRHGLGLHPQHIGSSIRFAHTHASDYTSIATAGQVLLFLHLASIHAQIVHQQQGMRQIAQTKAWIGIAQFFVDQSDSRRIQTAAAIVGVDGQAQEAQIITAELPKEVEVKGFGLVVVIGLGFDL